jgi:phage-related protein
VREWLKGLEREDRKVIGEDIKDVEFSWPIRMPLVRWLGNKLWEVRSSLPRAVLRGLFHGFMKKSQMPPQRDIDLALKRKKGTRT